jgi:hypothetical protein
MATKATTIRPYTWKVPEDYKQRFEDVFVSLVLGQALFSFPTLIEKERQTMNAIIIGRSDLKVVR